MTVAELIAVLQKQPQNVPVFIIYNDADGVKEVLNATLFSDQYDDVTYVELNVEGAAERSDLLSGQQ